MNENQTAIIEMNLRKLKEPDTNTKANCLKSISFLMLNYKSQMISFVESILGALEDTLILNENDVNLLATNLVQQILLSYEKDQVYNIFKKKIIKLLVKNLGETKMQLRKLSHKCLLEFVKKYEDYDSLIYTYLKEGLENNNQNIQLKQKCLNSFQSILILEFKSLNFSSIFTRRIFQHIIDILFKEQNPEVLKAASQCMATICRLKGIKPLIGCISKQHVQKLEELGEQLSEVGEAIAEQQNLPVKKTLELKEKTQLKSIQALQPSTKPSLTPINLERLEKKASVKQGNDYTLANITTYQKKKIGEIPSQESVIEKASIKLINEQIAEAEQMLKRMEQYRNDQSIIEQIDNYIPTLENNFVDKRTQLFSISLRMIQLILDIKVCDDRFYVKLVPSIVDRLNDQKFLIRNSINKIIKQYVKTYTLIWIANFFNSLKNATGANFKQDLMNLLIYAYELFCPIDYDAIEAITLLSKQSENKRKILKNKAIECMMLIINQSTDNKLETALRGILSEEMYELLIGKIDRGNRRYSYKYKKTPEKLGKMTENIHENSAERMSKKLYTDIESKQSESNQKRRYRSNQRKDRMITEIQTSKKQFKKHQSMQSDQKIFHPETQLEHEDFTKVNISYNPQKYISPNKIRVISLSTPKGKLFKQAQAIEYIDKDNLPVLSDPKKQAEGLLEKLRDKSWKVQFSAVNCARSMIEYHEQFLSNAGLPQTVEQILKGVLSLRSSISKNSLICLDELINKFKRKLDCHIEVIVDKVMKKTLYTNQFLQQEVKRCLNSIATNLNESKLFSSLFHHKDSKSLNVKLNILMILENLIKNEKTYKRQNEAIWSLLNSFKDEPSIQVRDYYKKNVGFIVQNYPDWKGHVSRFMKKQEIERIEDMEKKSKKALRTSFQRQDKAVLNEKINFPQDISSHKKSSKEATQSPKKLSVGSSLYEFSHLEEIEKGCKNYKDWKGRILSLNQIFRVAFKYSKDFCDYSGSARYIMLLCENLQDPNIKVALNGLALLQQCLTQLKPLVQENLIHILLRLVNGMASKKAEYSTKCQQVYTKLKGSIQNNKLIKQLLKLVLNPILKTKVTALKQLDDFIYTLSKQALNSLGPIILKIVNRLSQEEKNLEALEKIKQLSNSLNYLLNNKTKQH